MAIRVQRHANVSKQATLLDGFDVSTLKWRIYGCGLNRFVHEGMNHFSNIKVHLKTRSGKVNIKTCILWQRQKNITFAAARQIDRLCKFEPGNVISNNVAFLQV